MALYKLAQFHEVSGNTVSCHLCPHECVISLDNTGFCRTRKNINGQLIALNYGRVSSMQLDPIEKKPLNRYMPGSRILSVGTFGCNLRCSYCQNWTIAQVEADTMQLSPERLVEEALKYKHAGNIGIAFTYNEPSIWFEYILDTCKLSRKMGLKNVLVTNGFINKEPLMELLPYIDAMNIDVKAFSNKFYSDICKGNVVPVKTTVEEVYKHCHVEITTLIIPDLNDNDDEIRQLSSWLGDLSPSITLHLTRYFPNFRMTDRPPTPIETLKRLKQVADKYLNYVYLGNV